MLLREACLGCIASGRSCFRDADITRKRTRRRFGEGSEEQPKAAFAEPCASCSLFGREPLAAPSSPASKPCGQAASPTPALTALASGPHCPANARLWGLLPTCAGISQTVEQCRFCKTQATLGFKKWTLYKIRPDDGLLFLSCPCVFGGPSESV